MNTLPKSSRPVSQRPEAVLQIKKVKTQTLTGARLQRHADYQRAYAASRKRQAASMSWFLAPQDAGDVARVPGRVLGQDSGQVLGQVSGPRVGLTAGKVLGKAHERNRIKRRMREALRRHVELLPAECDLILHPRRSVLTIEFGKLEAEIVRILHQAQAEAARLKQLGSESAEARTEVGAAKPAL